MTLRRRRILAAFVLGGFLAFSATWLLRLDYGRTISLDVLDLIPPGERAPEIMLARQLARETEARTMLFALAGPGGAPAPAAAALQLAAELSRMPEFEQAIAMADPAPRDAVGRELFAQRLALLFPQWLARREREYVQRSPGVPWVDWLANETVARLERFLAQPAAMGFQDLLGSDPLLLLPDAIERLGGFALAGDPQNARAALVWARTAEPPLSVAGQEPVFAAIARASDTVRAGFPGLEVRYTGVNRFAAASRARIQREVAWLNTASLTAVLAIGALFIRQLHRGLHLIPVVVIAMTGALVAATMAFDRLHVVVLVIGAMLVGIAIDYGFHLFLHPPAYPGEQYSEKVRRLLKPLLASCLTTVAGFSLLLASELPLIRQVGLFVAVGLICALIGALLYLGTLAAPHLPTRHWGGGRMISERGRRWSRRVVVALWLAALPGLSLLTWRDDIQELEIPSPRLRVEDAQIRALFGNQSAGAVYLTRGSSALEARDALQRFEVWLREAVGAAPRLVNLGDVIPTLPDYQRAIAFTAGEAEFPLRLREALGAAGFEPDEFAPFFADYARHAAAAPPDPEPAARALHGRLVGPQASLLHIGADSSWFVTITDGPALAPPPETQTVTASQLQSLNRIFSEYRESALRLSIAGLALVGLGVVITYGLRNGLLIFAIPGGVCLGIFGLFGWLGEPLNMFHLLGALVGVCLTHDYAIFTAASAFRGEAPPASVRVSALTTAASFSVLAASGIPVVRALGITVAAMVLAALIAIEFEALRTLERRHSADVPPTPRPQPPE